MGGLARSGMWFLFKWLGLGVGEQQSSRLVRWFGEVDVDPSQAFLSIPTTTHSDDWKVHSLFTSFFLLRFIHKWQLLLHLPSGSP